MTKTSAPVERCDSDIPIRDYPDTEQFFNEDQMIVPTRMNLLQMFGSSPDQLAKLSELLLLEKK